MCYWLCTSGSISITARTDRKGYCPDRCVVGCVPRVRSQSQLEQTGKVTVQVGVLLVVYLGFDLNHSWVWSQSQLEQTEKVTVQVDLGSDYSHSYNTVVGVPLGLISITARTDGKGYCPSSCVVGCVPRVWSQSQLEHTGKVAVQVGVLLVVYLMSNLSQLEQTGKVTVQVGVLLVVYLGFDLNHS